MVQSVIPIMTALLQMVVQGTQARSRAGLGAQEVLSGSLSFAHYKLTSGIY
jgi:hypothetical protein